MDISQSKNVRINNHCSSAVAHDFWRHETSQSKRLEVVWVVDSVGAVSEIALADELFECGQRVDIHNLNRDVFCAELSLYSKFGKLRAEDLLVVGLDKNSVHD